MGHTMNWQGPVVDLDDITALGIRGKGCVYVAACGDKLKIGISDTPRRRLISLQNGMGAKFDAIWVIGPVEDAARIESIAHQRLKEVRAVGEWFNAPIKKGIAAVQRAVKIAAQLPFTTKDIQAMTGLSKPQIRRIKQSPLSDEYHAKKYGAQVSQVQQARASGI